MRKQTYLLAAALFVVTFTHCEADRILIGTPESQADQTVENPTEENPAENDCGAEVAVIREGLWEEPLDAYGCSWYFITLQIQNSATSIHCRILDSSEMSCYGNGWSSTCWSAVDYTLYNESKEFDLGGACCLDVGDVLHGLIACECTGTAYLHGHEGELISGTYDQSKVIFLYETPSYTCPSF
jgi:hypothetical protein